MTREDRMIKHHIDSLTQNYEEKILKTFGKPKLEGDTVTSISESKRLAHITRHHISYMGEPTHAIFLNEQTFDRL